MNWAWIVFFSVLTGLSVIMLWDIYRILFRGDR